MKKVLLIFLVTMFAVLAASAQSGKGIALSFGPDVSFPINTSTTDYGNIRDYYQDGIGGVFKVEVPLNKSLYLTGSVGLVYYRTNLHYSYNYNTPLYLNIQGANSVSNQPPEPASYYFLPVKAGLRYYYDQFLYIGAEAGDAIKANSATTNAFIYAAGTGGIIRLSKHGGLDLGVRFERGFEIVDYPSPMSQFSINAAYRYRF